LEKRQHKTSNPAQKNIGAALEIPDEKLPRLAPHSAGFGNSETKASEDWERLPQKVLTPAFSGPSFIVSAGSPATQQPNNWTTSNLYRAPPTAL